MGVRSMKPPPQALELNEYPYFWDYEENEFKKIPWHHHLFSQFRWYHKWTGGNWKYIQLDSSFANWQRLQTLPPWNRLNHDKPVGTP
jgi:hypothetical protein